MVDSLLGHPKWTPQPAMRSSAPTTVRRAEFFLRPHASEHGRRQLDAGSKRPWAGTRCSAEMPCSVVESERSGGTRGQFAAARGDHRHLDGPANHLVREARVGVWLPVTLLEMATPRSNAVGAAMLWSPGKENGAVGLDDRARSELGSHRTLETLAVFGA